MSTISGDFWLLEVRLSRTGIQGPWDPRVLEGKD